MGSIDGENSGLPHFVLAKGPFLWWPIGDYGREVS
jgi:hypothetical protein